MRPRSTQRVLSKPQFHLLDYAKETLQRELLRSLPQHQAALQPVDVFLDAILKLSAGGDSPHATRLNCLDVAARPDVTTGTVRREEWEVR
jgi:hypothetical protein